MRLFLHLFNFTFLSLCRLHGSFARRHDGFTNFTVTEQCPPASATRPPIISIIFPSPEALPVEVISQSQVVVSYIPEMTWCVGPPIGLIPITPSGPPYLNYSTIYSTTFGGTGSCETVYVPTATTVCATTLTGLASKVTVTECDQEITFSSECGFTLETPTPVTSGFSLITPPPTVKRMTTFWMAPWQSLTLGETPSDVDVKICTVQGNGDLECLRYQEVWEVVVVTKTITTQRQLTLATTFSGPGTLIVETIEMYITDTIETIDLTTTLLLETEIETETTRKGKKLVTRPGDGEEPKSTAYITKKVKYKSTKPAPTTTVRVTSVATKNVGTVTRTRSRPRPTLLDMVV